MEVSDIIEAAGQRDFADLQPACPQQLRGFFQPGRLHMPHQRGAGMPTEFSAKSGAAQAGVSSGSFERTISFRALLNPSGQRRVFSTSSGLPPVTGGIR